jgi:aryl-alcohol dehydrogenase-like predicted oxidoreductase
MGRFNRNNPKSEGIKIIREAVEKGITIFNTAEIYKTHYLLKKRCALSR